MEKIFCLNRRRLYRFRDREVLERVRNLTREEITQHSNPDFKIKIVPDARAFG